MGKAPAFQFYANDFMDATSTWQAIAVGLYVRCLCKQWTHGSIPGDLKTLARATHCDLSEVQEAWPMVRTKFIDQGDGTLINKRLEEVRARQIEVSGERSKAGKAGAIARANVKANASTKAKQRKVKVEGEVEREIEGEQEGKERAHEAELEPTFSQWFDLYDKRKAQGECRVKWRTLGQQVHEAIMEHTARLVATTPKEFRKDPIRYLSKQGWEDEIIQRTTANGTKTDEQRNAESRDALAKHFANRHSADAGTGGGA